MSVFQIIVAVFIILYKTLTSISFILYSWSWEKGASNAWIACGSEDTVKILTSHHATPPTNKFWRT